MTVEEMIDRLGRCLGDLTLGQVTVRHIALVAGLQDWERHGHEDGGRSEAAVPAKIVLPLALRHVSHWSRLEHEND